MTQMTNNECSGFFPSQFRCDNIIMLETVDFTQTRKESSPKVRFLFILLSFSYMLPWTAMGSLIHYFSEEYSKNYFTMLNIAFYGVGLPVTYLQKRYDAYHDAIHGSKLTFKTRIHVCLLVQVSCLIVAPYAGYYGLVIVSMIIGCATWMAHSCTTSLSGMVKFNSSIMQQIGFALPAVFGIITSIVFNLSSDNIPDLNVKLFFWSIALFVLPGNICWHFMHKSPVVRAKLLAKDSNLGTLLIESALDKSDARDTSDLDSREDSYNPVLLNGEHDQRFSSVDVQPRPTNTVRESDIAVPGGRIDSSSFRLDNSRYSAKILKDAKSLLKEDSSLIKGVMRSEECSKILQPYRWTLFITIFASILQGSFISYTFGMLLYDKELPTILYFVRIFADLFGRPLGLLPRPKFLSNVHGLLKASVFRMILSLYFYTIIVNTFYPEDFVDSNACHIILIAFQFFFSASSGYLNSLTYEFASAAFDSEWLRVLAAQQLNLTFQKACTCAVMVALFVLLFVEVIKDALGFDIHTK